MRYANKDGYAQQRRTCRDNSGSMNGSIRHKSRGQIKKNHLAWL